MVTKTMDRWANRYIEQRRRQDRSSRNRLSLEDIPTPGLPVAAEAPMLEIDPADVPLQPRTTEALPRFRGSRRNRHAGKGAREDRWWLRATQSGGTLRKPFVYRGARSRLERELDELQGPELEEVA
jgi:hypothetical protein